MARVRGWEFVEMAAALDHWLGKNDINPDEVKLIIEFPDVNTQMSAYYKFHMESMMENSNYLAIAMPQEKRVYKIFGIEIKFASRKPKTNTIRFK